MSKKVTKSRKYQKTQKCDGKSILCHPSTWLIAMLATALLVVCGVAAYGFKELGVKSELDSAKLAVFDNLIDSYAQEIEINSEKPSVNEVTGYGISDEDGVFYVTMDFVYVSDDLDANGMSQYGDLNHGILYFWKDTEHNTYSHAFSYHDDYYRPGGVYTEIGDHYLRNQFESDK